MIFNRLACVATALIVVGSPSAQQLGQNRIAHIFSFAKDPAGALIGICWSGETKVARDAAPRQ